MTILCQSVLYRLDVQITPKYNVFDLIYRCNGT